MKVPVVLAAIVVAASTASAYVCPSPTDVAYACKQLNVFPLVCYNPDLNKDACNAKQCHQQYIDDYAVCYCRRTTTNFYEHSRNVEGLIRRCGGGLINPYGPSNQYEPNDGSSTQVGDGTISAQSKGMSGGAIAGTVLGILGALGLAGLLGWCWRRSRAAHVPAVSTTTHVGHEPARTVVSEKIEPLVVKSANAGQTNHAASVPVAATTAGSATPHAGHEPTRTVVSEKIEPLVVKSAHVGHEPARTVVSEKIEPLVVKSTNAGQTHHAASAPVAATAAGADAAAGAAGGAAYASRSQPARSNTNYTNTTSGVPAPSTSHVQPGTTTTYTTTGTSSIPAPSGQTTSSIGQPGSTTKYNTASSSGGNTHVHPGVSSTTYSTSGQQAAGATNASTTYTSGSSAGHTTIQPSSTTNTTYNTATSPGGNAATSGSGNAGQTGNSSTIYSSNNGYNPKSHN